MRPSNHVYSDTIISTPDITASRLFFDPTGQRLTVSLIEALHAIALCGWMLYIRILYDSIDLYKRISRNLMYYLYIMVSHFNVTSHIIGLVNVRIEMVLRMHKLSCSIFSTWILLSCGFVLLYNPIQSLYHDMRLHGIWIGWRDN